MTIAGKIKEGKERNLKKKKKGRKKKEKVS